MNKLSVEKKYELITTHFMMATGYLLGKEGKTNMVKCMAKTMEDVGLECEWTDFILKEDEPTTTNQER